MVKSTLLLIILGTLLSIGLASAGRAYWERRPGSADLLFGELMIWGWLRRWRIERRLSRAMALLELGDKGQSQASDQLSPEQQAQLLEDLANALEGRDPYTHGHSRRVARHSAMIAKRMGLSRSEVSKVRTAAAVHDVGKIDTPTEILNKPERLSDAEFEVIKQHPVRGAEMVDGIRDEELVWMVRHHHERLDGAGYPVGLSGDDIPLGARIIAVADSFDAITSARPYRSAKPHKQALDILNKEAGTQLDPTAVRAFSSYYSGFRPLALWVALTHLPQRLLYPLAREVSAAAGGAASAAKVMAATAATAALGSAVVGSEVAAQRSAHASHSALTGAEAAVAFSTPGQVDQLGFLGSSHVPTDSGSVSLPAPGGESGAQDRHESPPDDLPSETSDSEALGFSPAPAPPVDSETSVGQELVGAEPSITPVEGSSSGQITTPAGSQGGDPSESSTADQGGGSSSDPGGSNADPGGSSSDPGGSSSDPGRGSNSGRGGGPNSRGDGGSSAAPGGGPSSDPGSGGSQGGGPSSGRGGGSSSGGGGGPSSGSNGGGSQGGGSTTDPSSGGSQGGGPSSGRGGGSSSGGGGGPSSGSNGGGSQGGGSTTDPGGSTTDPAGSTTDPAGSTTDPGGSTTDPGGSSSGGGGSSGSQGSGSSGSSGGGRRPKAAPTAPR